MADFSFAPDPALGWGSRSSMGAALWQALQRGLGMQRMFEDQSYNSARHDMDMHLMPFDGQRQYWADREATDQSRLGASQYEDEYRRDVGRGMLSGAQMDTPNGYGYTTPFAPFVDHAMAGGNAGGYVSPNVGGPNTASRMFAPHPAQHTADNPPIPTIQSEAFNHFMNGTPWHTTQGNLFNPNWQPGANAPTQFPAGYFNSAFGG